MTFKFPTSFKTPFKSNLLLKCWKSLCSFLLEQSYFYTMRVSIALFTALAVTTKATEQVQTPLSDGADQVNQRPNIIVILTDDQDLHLGSLDYMPLLKKHITDEGTFHKRHYCTTAICCPSRVTCKSPSFSSQTQIDTRNQYGQDVMHTTQTSRTLILPMVRLLPLPPPRPHPSHNQNFN